MASLKYVKSSTIQTVTLGSGYTSGSGTMVLTGGEGALLPSSGDFWLSWTDGAGVYRIFKVTARSTDTLTVAAVAGEGSGDGNISSGETLRWDLDVDALDQLRQDICKTGADASKSAEKAGSIYLPNDGFQLYRDTGAAFAPWGPLFPMTAPDNSAFTDLNSPSSVVTTNGGVFLQAAAGAGDQVRGRQINVPSAPYTVEVAFHPLLISADYSSCGMFLSDGTKLVTWAIAHSFALGTILSYYRLSYWNSVTSFQGDYFSNYANRGNTGPVVFVRIVDDNTNRKSSLSTDGQNWLQIHSISRTDWLTPTKIGFYANSSNATYAAAMTLVSWKSY